VCETELKESKHKAYDKCVGFPGEPDQIDEPEVVQLGDKTEDLNQNLDSEPFLNPGDEILKEDGANCEYWSRCMPRDYEIGKIRNSKIKVTKIQGTDNVILS
jgi:hypothetical protein